MADLIKVRTVLPAHACGCFKTSLTLHQAMELRRDQAENAAESFSLLEKKQGQTYRNSRVQERKLILEIEAKLLKVVLLACTSTLYICVCSLRRDLVHRPKMQ